MRRSRLLIGAFLAAGTAVWWLNSAPSSSRTDIVSVPPGTPAYRVAHLLEARGHVRSSFWFVLLARARVVTDRIRAGTYEVRAGQSASAILSDMVSGRTRKVRVTIPEGYASWQVAEELARAGVCSAAGFLAAVGRSTGPALTAAPASSWEGFLFPETYYFEENTPPEQARDVMLFHFDRAWEEALLAVLPAGAVTDVLDSTAPRGEARVRWADGRVFTQREIVALASLVEREARKPEERALISAVYHNRLKKRMPLEADPTIQFALGYWKERIVYEDLEIAGPYNTYRRRGLPPGPICSPGRESLRAALAPAPADYLYFVADVTGGHLFSSTYSEHLKKVRQWNTERRLLRIRKRREERERSSTGEEKP